MIAMEIEWNNKDPFFDRDLENFKRLHAEGAISVGVIVTRGRTLQDQMYDNVFRFAGARKLTGMSQLDLLGLNPTKPQRAAMEKAMKRSKKPASFAEAWASKFVSDKFGQATTHWRKLEARVSRGVGNPCPLLLIGLPVGVIKFDPDSPIIVSDDAEQES